MPQLLGLGASTGQNACSLQRTVWNVLDSYRRLDCLMISPSGLMTPTVVPFVAFSAALEASLSAPAM